MQVVDMVPIKEGTAHTYRLTSRGGPFIAALVWYDYPADINAHTALVNDLDLLVEVSLQQGEPATDKENGEEAEGGGDLLVQISQQQEEQEEQDTEKLQVQEEKEEDSAVRPPAGMYDGRSTAAGDEAGSGDTGRSGSGVGGSNSRPGGGGGLYSQAYLGNGPSEGGGLPDRLNTVERVALPDVQAGATLTVTVRVRLGVPRLVVQARGRYWQRLGLL
jgi:hypothetical protein